MKNRIYAFLILVLFLTITPVKAFEVKENLSQIGFHLLTEKDDKSEISSIMQKQQKYANHQNMKKFRSLYSSDYTNSDGIELEQFFTLMQRTWDMNEKLTYNTVVDSISVNGEYATVETTEDAIGTTKDSYEKIPGKGVLKSTSKTVYYLKKVNNDWKIYSDWIISEKTSISYGIAKDADIKLEAPECINAGTQYDVTLNVKAPEKTAIIASIVSEPIQYPQVKSEEVFRAIKHSGEIERVLTSNNDGKNEVAFASVAIARAVEAPEEQVNIAIDGVAFLVSRVNVIPKKAKNNE